MSGPSKKQPAPVFTHDTTEWVSNSVRFHSPSREMAINSKGVAVPVVVWRALCTHPGCDTEFRLGVPLKKDGTARAPSGRRYCTAHARLSRGLPADPWDNPIPAPPFFTDEDDRVWRWSAYERAHTLGGEPVALAVWESECLVGGCDGVVVQKGLPNSEGYPSFILNAYCADHKQGGPKAAAGYDATFKRVQADYDAATPEEKARIDAKKAALVDAARKRENERLAIGQARQTSASLPEQRKAWERRLRMAVDCGAKTVEALARKRGRSASDIQKRVAESGVRIERKWMGEWNAAHPESPFYCGPSYSGPSTDAVVHSPVQAPLLATAPNPRDARPKATSPVRVVASVTSSQALEAARARERERLAAFDGSAEELERIVALWEAIKKLEREGA